MSKVLVSIVINNFNYAQFVGAAIDSALAQDHENTEVIVVDDGSTDGSQQIIHTYGNRIRAAFQENEGQPSALNHGFELAAGEIIIFLDADDMLMPSAVSTVVRLWKPGISKLHFRLQGINASGEQIPLLVPRAELAEGDVRPSLVSNGMYVCPPTSGNAFSRRALKEVMPICNVWPWLRGADAYLLHTTPFFGEVAAHQGTLGYYRLHQSNVSAVSVSPNKVSVHKIETLVALEEAKARVIQLSASRVGYPGDKHAALNNYTLLKGKLALCRLGPRVPGAHTVATLWRLTYACYSSRGLRFPMRETLLIWAVCVAAAPKWAVTRLVSIGLSPARRPRWLQKTVLVLSPGTK